VGNDYPLHVWGAAHAGQFLEGLVERLGGDDHRGNALLLECDAGEQTARAATPSITYG